MATVNGAGRNKRNGVREVSDEMAQSFADGLTVETPEVVFGRSRWRRLAQGVQHLTHLFG